MKKIRSYGFWVALSGAVVMLVNALGKIFGFAVKDELVSGLIMAIAGVLVVFGVVVMPKNDKKEDEDKKEEQTDDKQDDNQN